MNIKAFSTFAIIFLVSSSLFGFQDENKTASEDASPTHWYRGNLHTHSLWSDGDGFPEMITKWYADNGYHFLALTDHNILSEGEKWMAAEAILKRGGSDTVIEEYKKAWGDDWVETRVNDNKKTEIRLKTLEEYRGKLESPGKFLLLAGEEISDAVDGLPLHMNATNVKTLIRPSSGKTMIEAMNNNLRAAIEQSKKIDQPILVHLNHPNFGWAITAEDLAMVTLEKYFEIFNAHPSVNQLGDKHHPSLERLWDIANTVRIDQLNAEPLMGLATDDSHNYHGKKNGSSSGRAWVMVRAHKLSPEAILTAMDQGDFYSSTGVELAKLEVTPEGVEIGIKQVEGQTFTTRFVGTLKGFDSESKPRDATRVKQNGKKPIRLTRVYSNDVGKTLATVKGNSASYKFTGNELYVRAIVTSSADHPNPSIKDQKQQAWTQPARPVRSR